MDNKILTYSTLWNLVDSDDKEHELKKLATIFLTSMNDWPTENQQLIKDFIYEVNTYFGTPLTVDKINHKKFDGQNAWQIESGASIIELINKSTKVINQSNFDKIIENILNYYNAEFNKVDFIAELTYFTQHQGGRATPVHTGYRPHIKFNFSENMTSGQQTFINKEIVYPGEKVDAKIKILTPEFYKHSLTEGQQFDFREGARIIGTGIIKYIINDNLENTSR